MTYQEAHDLIFKGKKAQIGEIRQRKNGKFQKTVDGWVEVIDNKNKNYGEFKDFSLNFIERDEFYKKEIKNLKFKDNKEYESIMFYSGSGSYKIRKFLNKERDNSSISSNYGSFSLEDAINYISSFIKQNKIKIPLILHRRVRAKNLFYQNLNVGDVYEDNTFTSTSLENDNKNQYGEFYIKILARKDSSVANIDNKEEFEYLIDKNSKFKVLEKRSDNLGITVELL